MPRRKPTKAQIAKSKRVRAERTSQLVNRVLLSLASGALTKGIAEAALNVGDYPARNMSYGNRILLALQGHPDSRTYNQWQDVGRQVRRGQRAECFIFEPLRYQIKDDEATNPGPGASESSGPEFRFVGCKPAGRFHIGQTDRIDPQGDDFEPPWRKAVSEWPLYGLAVEWGLSVELMEEDVAAAIQAVALSTSNSIVVGFGGAQSFLRELARHADIRAGHVVKPDNELQAKRQAAVDAAVYELAAAALLSAVGRENTVDLYRTKAFVDHFAKGAESDSYTFLMEAAQRALPLVESLLEECDRVQSEAAAAATDEAA